MDKDARNYYLRILAMLKEREASKLKLPSDKNDSESLPNQGSPPKSLNLKEGSTFLSPNSRRVSFLHGSPESESELSEGETKQEPQLSLVVQTKHLHKHFYDIWIQNLESLRTLHLQLSKHMDRGNQFKIDCERFGASFDSETSKVFNHVYCGSCVLEVRPMKVENITSKNSVHVKISYGEKVLTLIYIVC